LCRALRGCLLRRPADAWASCATSASIAARIGADGRGVRRRRTVDVHAPGPRPAVDRERPALLEERARRGRRIADGRILLTGHSDRRLALLLACREVLTRQPAALGSDARRNLLATRPLAAYGWCGHGERRYDDAAREGHP